MQRIEIQVARRDPQITARSLRREGKLPAVFYGAGGKNIQVEVDARQFTRLGLGSSGAHLIRFNSEEPALNNGVALVREVQTHPVSGALVHVDFLRLDLSKPVEAEVALSFVGKPLGVVEGGILQPLRRELHVRALPDNLPGEIVVEVSGLNIHDSVHVADVALPEGVEALFTENFTVVTVVPPVVEAVAEEEEAEAEALEAGAVAAEEAPGEDAGDEAEEKSS